MGDRHDHRDTQGDAERRDNLPRRAPGVEDSYDVGQHGERRRDDRQRGGPFVWAPQSDCGDDLDYTDSDLDSDGGLTTFCDA